MDTKQPGPPIDLQQGFHLGEWQVEPKSNTLRRAGHPSHVEPKVMDVLVCLASHQGEVVSREQLLDQVWQGYVVTEEVLTRCISELRTALGDTARERRFIRTVPKRGYMLIMPCELMSAESARDISTDAANDCCDAEEEQAVRDTLRQHKKPQSGEENLVSEVFHFLHAIIRTLGKVTAVALGVGGLIIIIGLAIFFDEDQSSLRDQLQISIQDDTSGTELILKGRASEEGTDKPSTPPSVAVLPFVNLSGDPQLEYFSSGLAEDIRNQLINTGGIQVAARTSSEVFRNQAIDIREIGRQLNVSALVEGTVRLNGERLRLTVQLTDANNGYPIWSERYEQNYSDVFAIQDQISGKVVEHLAPTLKPVEATHLSVSNDVRAYDYYLLGRHHWNQRTADSIGKAVDYFRRALALDANYALAYSGLADALVLQVDYLKGIKLSDATAEAQKHVDKAMVLNPNLAEVHASQGLIYWMTGRLEQSQLSYERAVSINPNYSMARTWLGSVLVRLGDVKNAYPHYQAALAVDPLHPIVQINYLHAKMMMGRYDEVTEDAQRFYSQTPDEKLLKTQMSNFLKSGQYDKVLDFAVRHNFSDHYASYATHILVEALIFLERFSEVNSLIEQNPGQLSADELSWFRAMQARAAREPDKILLAAEQLIRSKDSCYRLGGYQFAGQAYLMKEDFSRANQHFLKGIEKPTEECEYDPVNQIRLYASYAKSLQLAGNTAEADRLLNKAFSQWDQLAAGGWDGADMMLGRASLEVVKGNYSKAEQLLQTMARRGWQPYGKVRQNPLFDGLQEQLFSGEQNFSEVAAVFREMQQQCKGIGLTKFGI